MRYTIHPSNLLEWFALKAGSVPRPILDTTLPIIQARALMAANSCGVLRKLAERDMTAPELATVLGLDRECLTLLLRVIAGLDYVARIGSKWALTTHGRRYFGPAAPESYEAFVEYGAAQWRFVEDLEDVLRSGKGIDFHAQQTPAEWQAYQRSMLENAKAFGWFVAQHTPVPSGALSCLDLAGSHGYVGGLLCERHPPMRSTVMDRREALATARTLGEGTSWHRHVNFQEGDLLKDDYGRDRDVVLLCNILHHFSAETNGEVLRRVHDALKPGGAVSIFEIESPEEGQKTDAAGDGFALYFRITSTSTCFRASDYTAWLLQGGFQQPRVVRSIQMPSRMLVVATKA